MKIKSIIFIISITFFTSGMALAAKPAATDNSAVIGLGLDPTPLPDLLVKHLLLKTGQGIRVVNVMKGSAADSAGIERDDIVIGFQGKELYSSETISSAVRQAAVGTEVSLDIIHLGQRKTVTLKLRAKSETSGWKYPDEPQVEQLFQPGRVFRFGPGDQSWTQIFNGQIPGNVQSDINTFFNELYSSQYNINGKQYTVTIEGNPDNKDSKITVKIDNNEYKATIGELDKIPQEHREAAKNAIENARQKKSYRIEITPGPLDDSGNFFTPGQGPRLKMPNGIDSSIFEKFQEQMKQMQERFNDLQKSQQQILERLNEQQQPKI